MVCVRLASTIVMWDQYDRRVGSLDGIIFKIIMCGIILWDHESKMEDKSQSQNLGAKSRSQVREPNLGPESEDKLKINWWPNLALENQVFPRADQMTYPFCMHTARSLKADVVSGTDGRVTCGSYDEPQPAWVEKAQRLATMLDHRMMSFDCFDRVLECRRPDEQEELFNVIRPAVAACLGGHSCSIVAHGGPQSGKSYLLSGFFTKTELHGLAPRAIRCITEELEMATGAVPIVEASFFELLQDAVCDLLQSGCPRVGMRETTQPPYTVLDQSLTAMRCEGASGFNRLLDSYFTEVAAIRAQLAGLGLDLSALEEDAKEPQERIAHGELPKEVAEQARLLCSDHNLDFDVEVELQQCANLAALLESLSRATSSEARFCGSARPALRELPSLLEQYRLQISDPGWPAERPSQLERASEALQELLAADDARDLCGSEGDEAPELCGAAEALRAVLAVPHEVS
ncbi:unnamed protein product [Polarella glacialis]|uniref:Kinesin motor domain-containing protein n=1 Tax=Polarella glacialis TaxID=89957 RepID=A0A813HZB3_POLGL|nr:unnamed protein product [Polarella glacialis]